LLSDFSAGQNKNIALDKMQVRKDLSYADVVRMKPRLKKIVIMHYLDKPPKMFYYY
jgi:hypothetical protein